MAFFFRVWFGDAQHQLFNANCSVRVLLSSLHERCVPLMQQHLDQRQARLQAEIAYLTRRLETNPSDEKDPIGEPVSSRPGASSVSGSPPRGRALNKTSSSGPLPQALSKQEQEQLEQELGPEPDETRLQQVREHKQGEVERLARQREIKLKEPVHNVDLLEKNGLKPVHLNAHLEDASAHVWLVSRADYVLARCSVDPQAGTTQESLLFDPQ